MVNITETLCYTIPNAITPYRSMLVWVAVQLENNPRSAACFLKKFVNLFVKSIIAWWNKFCFLLSLNKVRHVYSCLEYYAAFGA